MDPSKLTAFMKDGEAPAPEEDEEGEDGDEGTAEEDEIDMTELIAALVENAPAVMEAMDMLDPSTFMIEEELDDDTRAAIEDVVENLPPDVVEQLGEHEDISMEDAHHVAAAVIEEAGMEDADDDPAVLGAFIFHAVHCAAEMGAAAEDAPPPPTA